MSRHSRAPSSQFNGHTNTQSTRPANSSQYSGYTSNQQSNQTSNSSSFNQSTHRAADSQSANPFDDASASESESGEDEDESEEDDQSEPNQVDNVIVNHSVNHSVNHTANYSVNHITNHDDNQNDDHSDDDDENSESASEDGSESAYDDADESNQPNDRSESVKQVTNTDIGVWNEPAIDERIVTPRNKKEERKSLDPNQSTIHYTDETKQPDFDISEPVEENDSVDQSIDENEKSAVEIQSSEPSDEPLYQETVDEEEEYSDEEQDEEPVLKYQRIGSDAARIIGQSTNPSTNQPIKATCMIAHSKLLVVGTSDGVLHVLDINGNEIARHSCHTQPINDLSIDQSAEHIASCSSDNTVCITNLYTKEQQRHAFQANVRSVALPSNFKHSAMFACGAGDKLCVNKKGWFSANNITIHSKEGIVSRVRWRRELIAWANEKGVKVYDVNTSERLTHIKRDLELSPAGTQPYLCWSTDSQLVIAWGSSVKIGSIQSRALTKAERQIHPDRSIMRFLQLTAMFNVDYLIAGISPYASDLLLILALCEEDEDDEESEGPLPPELRLVTHKNVEQSVDALPINGFEHCGANDYVLCGYDEKDVADDCWFVLAPHDLITARKRDDDDHISWLIEAGRVYDALQAALALKQPSKLDAHSVDALTDLYLHSLFDEGRYQQCAAECQRLLGMKQSSWEGWIDHFMKHGQLSAMVTNIPIFNPQLKASVYDRVMQHFLTAHDYAQLLSLITSWPKHIYDMNDCIASVKAAIDDTKRTNQTAPPDLLECLAELYIIGRNYSAALSVFLGLKRHDVFAMIRELNLFTLISDKISTLMSFDQHQAVALLVDNVDTLPVNTVISQLSSQPQHQLAYLHALFVHQQPQLDDYADVLLELYARFDAENLMPFLRATHSYSLDYALTVTEKHKLYAAQVFVLRRMGESARALDVIISKIGDVRQAISLIEEERDDALWSTLITHCIHHAGNLEQLLDYVGEFNVDLTKLMGQIPPDMEIKNLKAKLQRIFTDNSLHVEVWRASVACVKSEEQELIQRKMLMEREALLVEAHTRCAGCNDLFIGANSGAQQRRSRRQPRPSKSGTQPIQLPINPEASAISQSPMAVFLCKHVWHRECIVQALRKQGKNARNEIREHGLRCLTCDAARARSKWRSDHAEQIKQQRDAAKQQREQQHANQGTDVTLNGSAADYMNANPGSSLRSASPLPRTQSPRLNGKSSTLPALPMLHTKHSIPTRPSIVQQQPHTITQSTIKHSKRQSHT